MTTPQPEFIAPYPDLCTEEEISRLVHTFYARARKDPLLGPIFEAHVTNWDAHFVQMINFWSMKLRGTSHFRGAPMPKHVALPGLDADMFVRWLQLFHDTTETLPNRLFAERAEEAAHRIARSLWFGYQMNNNPDSMPKDLHNG